MHHSYKNQLFGEFKASFSGYPKFIYSGNNLQNLDGIPVFLYHTIDPAIFESHLLYLKNNDYTTLNIDEFHEILLNKNKTNHKRLVLLTIDDARSSVWRYAYPILKKYEMHATIFIIPGLTEESKFCRKNLEDFWNGKCESQEIRNIDPQHISLCNWVEIIQMYNSGFVNIESHTLFHREIFINTKITDFITPDSSFIPYDFPGSPYFSAADLGKKLSASTYHGLPIFESSPLMLAGPKLNMSPEFISKCKEVYHDASKINNDWKSAIKNIVNEQSSKIKYFSIEPHSKNDVLEDLKTARGIIQSKLDNNAGNHLCLPWTIGNNETINICKQLEIKSCFWGVLENKNINKPGDDPYFISRIKNDFIFRLPGRDRKSLFSIYDYKIKRRMSGEKPF